MGLDYEILYRKGIENVATNYGLSRQFGTQTEQLHTILDSDFACNALIELTPQLIQELAQS